MCVLVKEALTGAVGVLREAVPADCEYEGQEEFPRVSVFGVAGRDRRSRRKRDVKGKSTASKDCLNTCDIIQCWQIKVTC